MLRTRQHLARSAEPGSTGRLTSYYGRPLSHKIARARLQGTVSQYGWTLWGCIQNGASALDFDFWNWAMERFDAAVEEFRGPDFDRLLADVRAAD